ncbi:MAG: ABC transporter ATP-binding protein/permease [Candidatus Dormibacteraeota bacterium]|nr:ABC transporter ATP-binding protein/permease [Candidatus Dormibacteraeota bacterium]
MPRYISSVPDKYCVGPSMATDWGEEQPKISRRLLGRVFGYFVPYWRKAVVVLACIAAAAGLGLVPALVTKGLIDYLAHPRGGLGPLALIVGAGVAAAILGGLIGMLQSYLSTSISEGIMYDLREQLFGRLLKQSVGFFINGRSGDLLSRMDNDIAGVEDVISDTVFGLITSAIVVTTTLVLMFSLDWRLTLAALLILPVFLYPSRRIGQLTYRARKRTQEKLSEMSVYMQEVLGISGLLLVKAFTKERQEEVRFRDLNLGLRGLKVREAMIGRGFQALLNLLSTLGPALLLLFGGFLVLSGRTTVGTVVSVVTILAGRLAGAAGNLGNTHVNVTGSLALFQRVFQYIDLPPEVQERPGSIELPRVQGSVVFEGVSFAYPQTRRPALCEASFRVQPGQLVALVGPSGAGKTTATYLLARFYDPTEGTIRMDGHDLRDIQLESLSRNFGIVFQDTFLFHASLRENLLYARPDASQAEVEGAARTAHIQEFIDSLPDGYDTIVGERGHRLSGGEKQRIAIARVILKDPRIVILDEATSNLDSVSEQLIQAALRPLFAGRTSIVIAHRLSTVLAADRILVLDRGRLIDSGTHEELLERGGLYKTLYDRQFRPDSKSKTGLQLVSA